MRRQALSCRAGKGAVIAAALLAMVVGFCMLDSGGADHEMSWDFCAGVVLVSMAVPLLAVPIMTGWLSIDPAEFAYTVSLHSPDPPPKSLALS